VIYVKYPKFIISCFSARTGTCFGARTEQGSGKGLSRVMLRDAMKFEERQ